MSDRQMGKTNSIITDKVRNIIFIKASSKRVALKGGAPANFYEGAWRAAEERVKNNPDLCIVPDIESGFPVVMTQAQRKRMLEVWESVLPKVTVTTPGKIFFFGTGGSLDSGKSFEDLWNDVDWNQFTEDKK